jgi:hypothetical protein
MINSDKHTIYLDEVSNILLGFITKTKTSVFSNERPTIIGMIFTPKYIDKKEVA